jgi:hypothetical protein
MAVLRLGRFRASPAGTGEMLTSHATLGAAVEDAFPGLTGMQLAKAGNRRGTGVALGLTRRRAVGVAGAPGIPQAGTAFSPAQGIATRTSSMRDRTRPAHGKEMADPCGGRHAHRRAWPAPPPRHGIVLVLAARRGGEQA